MNKTIDEQILEQIRPIIAEKLGIDPDEVTMEANLQNDLGADSLDVIEIFMDAEKEFDCEVPDKKQEEIRTIGDVISAVKETSRLEWIHNGQVQLAATVAPKVAEPEQKPAVLNSGTAAKKFVIVQNFTYNPNTPDYSGRATQINVGVISEEVRKKFIEYIRNCKPIDGNEFHCGFDVYCDDKTGFEVRPNRKQPAVDWNVPDCLNRAGENEMVIEMQPGKLKETDCPVSRSHDCPLCIASGKCPSPFIRKYIGKVLFPNQYGKQR